MGTNIKLFPKLAQLKKLDLSGNRLSKGLEHLKDCPKLNSLSLVNNKFKDLETLKPLIDLKITWVDLDGNEFPEPKDEFRKKVFEMLPSLLLLDGVNKDGVEDNSDDDEDEEEGPALSALYDNTANLAEDDEADYKGGEAED